MSDLHDIFGEILDNYAERRKTEEKTNTDLKHFLTEDCLPVFENVVGGLSDINPYKADVSLGVRNLPKFPWFSVYDDRITGAASKGFYLVYLFKEDYSGMYLSLNQGSAYFTGEKNLHLGSKMASQVMSNVSGEARRLLAEYDKTVFKNRLVPSIELGVKQKKYQDCNVYALYYTKEEIHAFQDDESLKADLKEFLRMYDFLLGKIGIAKNTEMPEGFSRYEGVVRKFLPSIDSDSSVEAGMRSVDFRGLIDSAACVVDGGGVVAREPQNLIFHGAPGTGKTYNVLKACAELINGGGVDEPPLKWLNENADGRFAMVQFHPSYDYTDFVEGLRPYTADGGNVGFRLEPGAFMKLCARARVDSGRQYYMLVDEINRGDLSKIFGELFFLLDPGYRGQGVSTQYANMHDDKWSKPMTEPGHEARQVRYLDGNGEFSIPRNVTIIGTMNDIDRSVDSLDFAMRRRFRFVEVGAEASWTLLFGSKPDDAMYPSLSETRDRMATINKRIGESSELGRDYMLGATYFRSLAKAGGDGFESAWSETWNDRIEPLLREYLRGTGLAVADFNPQKTERAVTD